MVNNVNAQQWLDEKYPANSACKRNNDPENKNKKREDITKLDVSKGKIGNNYLGDGKNLVSTLKIENFTNLRKLIISSHQLISLDVSNCLNLEELDCRSNELTILNVTGCSNLRKIDCSNNPLRALNLSTCSSLEEVNITNCPNLTTKTIKSSLVYDSEKGKLAKCVVKSNHQISPAGENDIRNILIVGWTGNGKSTLANVLTGTNQFVEKDSGVSVTSNFRKSDIFEWEGKKYCLIDNIGFGDTSIPAEGDILFKIGEGIHAAKEGINQVLFAARGKFSDEQIIAFDTFKDFINESGITKFTTIVKTGFKDFRNPQECDKDRQCLLVQNKKIRKIIESCNDIIHVDNPSIPEIDEDDSDNEQEIKISNKKRKESREKVLKHLSEKCLEIYKLKEWDSIYSKVDNYIRRKKEIEQNNSPTKQEQLNQEWNEVTKGIKVGLGFELPTIGGFNASVEYGTQKKKYSPSQTHSQSTHASQLNLFQLQGSQETNIQSSDSQSMEIENEAVIRNKRSLSISSQTEVSREEIKISKVEEELENQLEQMEVDDSEQINQIETPSKK